MSKAFSTRRVLLIAAMFAGAAAAGASRLYAESSSVHTQAGQCIHDGCNGGSTGCEILPDGTTCLKGI